MKIDNIKEGVESLWNNLSEGWRHLWASSARALTHFKPGDNTHMPPQTQVDDHFWLPGTSWSVLGGDVFEDDKRLVVRLEVPGLDKDDINIDLLDDGLVVSGEKRFQNESTDGRWRVMQCAYGSFRRVVPLPTPVKADETKATLKNGVLKVELPKAQTVPPKSWRIKVE